MTYTHDEQRQQLIVPRLITTFLVAPPNLVWRQHYTCVREVLGALTILPEVFSAFLRSLQANGSMLFLLGHGRFLPNPSHLIFILLSELYVLFRSVGTVRSRTKATELLYVLFVSGCTEAETCISTLYILRLSFILRAALEVVGPTV
jgi:hypothetical protein